MKINAYPMMLASVAMLGMMSSCQDTYDLDEKLPPNFGHSLMSYLEQNNYENYRRLVEDLNYVEALQGSTLKTLFAADDEAFARFYASNPWGVHSYEELTLAQKKMLLYSSMLDNSLQIMNLSSTTGKNGVTEGNCMRRTTALSIYDSVPLIYPDQMPDNGKAWQYYRKNNKTIVCMKDMSVAPMMFLIEKFLQNNKITNDDVNFLFNYKIDRKSGDAFVNGIPVVEGNLRSANGFLHRVQDVMTPLPNMADLIASNPKTQTYSRFIERFSAPYYAGRDVTANYNYEYNTDVDSVFQKRYYSERSLNGVPTRTMPDGRAVEATLKFDPGWNSYYSDDPNALTTTVALQQNMGVMLVPSDSALDAYWNNGTGVVLRDYYGSWDNVPDRVLAKLINNNMLNSWTASVPSKFGDITNSTQDKMNIKPSDVEHVYLGCNGAVYLTKRVFSPTEYISVSFPALINETMSVFNWAIEQYQYGSYLNSLDSYYSLFIPTNDALLTYIDPVSYGSTQTQILRFHYRNDADSEDEKVWASVYNYDVATKQVLDSVGEMRGKYVLEKRLTDILDNHIVVGNVESGHEYYRTKNGGVVRVKNQGGNIVSVQNTWQMYADEEIPIMKVYDQSKETNGEGNGKTYILDCGSLMTTRNSVFDILEGREDCSLFYQLLASSDLHEVQRRGATAASKAGNVASFNNYHYTVYVPTNESLQAAIDAGKVMTWDEIERLQTEGIAPKEAVDSLKEQLNAFLRYHIQDNSLFIGMDYKNEGGSQTFTRNYETAIMNDETQKFYTLKVAMKPGEITLTDLKGNERHVKTSNPADYNLPAREYQLSGNNLSTSAFAVVHMIDGPLFFH